MAMTVARSLVAALLLAWAPSALADTTIGLIVTNPGEVAAREKGRVMVTLASPFVNVKRKTVEAIIEQMKLELAGGGVAAVVQRTPYTVKPEEAMTWRWLDAETGELVPSVLEAGTYEGVSIVVTNDEELFRKGVTSTLGLGDTVGSFAASALSGLGVTDPKQEVRDAVAAKVVAALRARGVQALVAP